MMENLEKLQSNLTTENSQWNHPTKLEDYIVDELIAVRNPFKIEDIQIEKQDEIYSVTVTYYDYE